MAKRKLRIEKFNGIPRGAEHLAEEIKPHDPKADLARLDKSGAEIPDPIPLAVPIKNKPFTTEQMRAQLEAIRASDGPLEFETFEEANDFDIEDDFGDFVSKWEVPADQQRAIDEYLEYRRTGELPSHIVAAMDKTRKRLNPQDNQVKPSGSQGPNTSGGGVQPPPAPPGSPGSGQSPS